MLALAGQLAYILSEGVVCVEEPKLRLTAGSRAELKDGGFVQGVVRQKTWR